MKGKIIADWGKVNFASREDRAKVVGALQHFMRQPGNPKSPLYQAIQHFSTKGDFPAEILQVLEKYHAVPDYDLGYEQIFDIRDFTGTNVSGFDILDVESGLTFSLVKPGGKAKVYGMSGSKVSVTFDMYGGALGWHRTLIDDRQYWQLEDNAIAFRNKAYYSRAANFYALIEAVTGKDVAWQAVRPAGVATSNENYDAIRDAETINYACNSILAAVKDKGYGVNVNTEFIVLAPAAIMGRVNQALKMLAQPVVGSVQRVQFRVRPIFTLMLSSNSNYYVLLPKNKMKGGNRMDLTMFDQFDILAYTDVMAGWMRYGGAIGDTDQVRKCALA
jgi:hypothetical protein